MTLEVPFEGFAEAARKLAPGLPAFASAENGVIRVTVADPAKAVRVVASSAESLEKVAESLRKEGLTVRQGQWVPDDAPPAVAEFHAAAIAYRTEGPKPGLWVDAFPEAPTAIQAMRALYDEFRANGEIAEVSFEEFMRLAEPTVVILSPAALKGFAAAKEC